MYHFTFLLLDLDFMRWKKIKMAKHIGPEKLASYIGHRLHWFLNIRIGQRKTHIGRPLITSLSHSSALLLERIMEDPMFLGEILLKPKSFENISFLVKFSICWKLIKHSQRYLLCQLDNSGFSVKYMLFCHTKCLKKLLQFYMHYIKIRW